MPTGYQIKEQDKLHFVTLQVVEWVDIFSRQKYRDIIIDNLSYCQKNKGLEIYAWVIMSNHIHLLVKSEKEELSNIMRDFKSYTSKKIIDEIDSCNESRKEWMLKLFKDSAFKHKRNSEYQFWTHENHAEHVFSNSFIEQKLDYIHNNPVRAGIVEKPEEYKYSSAKDYAGENGLLQIETIMRQWKTYK
ncbi:MAG: transposase [Bacteroidetes bacterium RIFCSPLOWO2_12_FULL_35_15]|nr:MAG: transposase [Bacteroidetes bacterium RIFCSPLOWO2_12_FULL_35_15]